MKTLTNNNIALAIYEASKDKKGRELREYLENVVKFLARKRFLSKSPAILVSLKKIINEKEGTIEAYVASAKKLGTETKHQVVQSIKKRYGAKDVILEEALDQGLLGGMRIEVNDEVIDLTYKNKLGKLKE